MHRTTTQGRKQACFRYDCFARLVQSCSRLMSLAYKQEPQMSTDHVRLGHLFAEIVSGHDVSRFDEILALGYVNHNPFAEPGPEGVKKIFGAIIAGLRDLKVFYPATENAFAMRSIDIWRFEDGRFVEHWDELNTLDIFSQVGAVPPLGQPS